MAHRLRYQTTIPLVAPSGGVVSGEPLVFGRLVVMPQDDAAEGEDYTCGMPAAAAYDGAPKATGEAWSAGDDLYWHPADEEWSTAAGGGTLGALAWRDAESAEDTGAIILLLGLG